MTCPGLVTCIAVCVARAEMRTVNGKHVYNIYVITIMRCDTKLSLASAFMYIAPDTCGSPWQCGPIESTGLVLME